MSYRFPRRMAARMATPLAAMLLGGCASVPADRGFGPVEVLARERLGQAASWQRSEEDTARAAATARKLLATQPLAQDDAVRIALLNNPALQAQYAELGIAVAERAQAGRMPNPGFSFARKERGGSVEFERALTFDLAHLIAMPYAVKSEQRRVERARIDAALDTLRVADATRRAWVEAVAAQQLAAYDEQVLDAASASAELARQMQALGNWGALQAAREQSFHARAQADAVRARAQALAARERLTRLLGLAGDDARYALSERLPDLPATPRASADLAAQAQQRLDLIAAQRNLEATAASLGLTRANRFVNALELGVMRNSETGEERQRGYEISFEIPLFDWGGARVAKAEAIYMQAAQQAAQTAVNAQSELRVADAAYRAAWDAARRYRDEIVPLGQKISEENLLRYNGMLISVFDLLADARAQIASVQSAIAAQRDFWLADSALQAALSGPAEPAALTTATSATPNAASAGH